MSINKVCMLERCKNKINILAPRTGVKKKSKNLKKKKKIAF